MKKIIIIIVSILIIGALSACIYYFAPVKENIKNKEEKYLASTSNLVEIYQEDGATIETIPRGSKVLYDEQNNKEGLYNVEYLEKEYYLKDISFLKDKEEETVLEKNIYVRTPQNLYEDDQGNLSTLVNKGEELTVIGFDYLLEDGNVNQYKVKYQDQEGYIYNKYVKKTLEEALDMTEVSAYYSIHQARGNRFGGGDAANLDYFPVEKEVFESNVMPEEVNALYLNASSVTLNNVDSYITIANNSNINAFVVDIKDNEVPGYQSEVMRELSPTNYNNAYNTVESYNAAITKLKDAGFYVIGRITVFKDKYYAMDHPENAITDTRTNQAFLYSGTYWPSPYQRDVWEFNVKLAKEAIELFKFNEIQFDYVRFPDRTSSYESAGIMDFKNIYGEDKAQAIQRFLQYATDEIHELDAYVSVDIFGESAYTYVTAYGQYQPAISNVVDVISPMPYPDHFNKYDFGFTEPVWTKPYDIMYQWGTYANARQQEISTPAKVRTWIQAYDTIREPYLVYGANEVSAQIQGLYAANLTGGYITWNSGSNINKYNSQIEAFKKEY